MPFDLVKEKLQCLKRFSRNSLFFGIEQLVNELKLKTTNRKICNYSLITLKPAFNGDLN